MHPLPTRPLAAAAAALLLVGALALASAEEPVPVPDRSPTSRLVTLHVGDPLSHTLNLSDGTFGGRIEGTLLVETRAHLDYGNYGDDALTLALEEDDRGILVDLGHWADVARNHDFEEVIGGGVAFASICVRDGEVKIARKHPRDTFQNLRDARPLLSTLQGEMRVSMPPVPGHIYLARVTHKRHENAPVYAKILVVSHVPGDHVTLRWDRIPGL